MSFFFSKQKSKAKRGSAPAKASKDGKETLNWLGCQACPLDKAGNCTPKFPPDLVNNTDIYILGGSPSEDDDEKDHLQH